jgi:hypothetical protein
LSAAAPRQADIAITAIHLFMITSLKRKIAEPSEEGPAEGCGWKSPQKYSFRPS